jgi:hypothetical protein
MKLTFYECQHPPSRPHLSSLSLSLTHSSAPCHMSHRRVAFAHACHSWVLVLSPWWGPFSFFGNLRWTPPLLFWQHALDPPPPIPPLSLSFSIKDVGTLLLHRLLVWPHVRPWTLPEASSFSTIVVHPLLGTRAHCHLPDLHLSTATVPLLGELLENQKRWLPDL